MSPLLTKLNYKTIADVNERNRYIQALSAVAKPGIEGLNFGNMEGKGGGCCFIFFVKSPNRGHLRLILYIVLNNTTLYAFYRSKGFMVVVPTKCFP